ncbi:Lectin [Glycine max]|nr:Lectin [Glycine max]
MLATSEHFHYFKTCLLLPIIFMILPIVQPLSFNITNFSDPEIASLDERNKINYGDGLTLYKTPLAFDYQTPPNFSGFSLGLYGGTLDNIVAVEFDTYINEYDQPMHRVGINNNSVASLEYKKFHIESNIGKMGHALIT